MLGSETHSCTLQGYVGVLVCNVCLSSSVVVLDDALHF